MILVDAHIHLHDCYRPSEFFDAAEANFRRSSGQEDDNGVCAGVLVFTEAAGERAFERLQLSAGHDANGYSDTQLGSWSVQTTGDDLSLRVTKKNTTIHVIAGRQIAAREGLEVLLLGSKKDIPDRLSITEVLEQTDDPDVIRIIPWGAGKWLFGRARLLSRLLEEHAGKNLFLGDESARPWFWTQPSHISEAAKLGIYNLPGTDPLPFPGEHAKVGGYGFRIDVDLGESPATDLVRAIRALGDQPQTYGARENAVNFVRNQVRMQLRKQRH